MGTTGGMIPDHLPELSKGTHERGSGKACIMNAISYINGDKEISDMPDCVHPALAKLAQFVNDYGCTHVPTNLIDRTKICPECSHKLWLIGARLIRSGEVVGIQSIMVMRKLILHFVAATSNETELTALRVIDAMWVDFHKHVRARWDRPAPRSSPGSPELTDARRTSPPKTSSRP